MKKIIICLMLVTVLAAPNFSKVQAMTEAEMAAKIQLIQVLMEQVAKLQELLRAKQQANGSTVQTNAPVSFTNANVTSITEQTVYSDKREKYWRHEIRLSDGTKLTVAYSQKASDSEIAKAFKEAGYTGTDLDALLERAKYKKEFAKPEKCHLEIDKKKYAPNELITLKWETSEPYAAFNAYGSKDKHEYISGELRDSSGTVTFRVSEPDMFHYVTLNTYPTKERFASGACTVFFAVEEAVEEEEEVEEDVPQPKLEYFTVEQQDSFISSGTVYDTVYIKFQVREAEFDSCVLSVKGPDGVTESLTGGIGQALTMNNSFNGGLPLPTYAEPGDKLDYILTCDSRSTSYTRSVKDALKETISITVE